MEFESLIFKGFDGATDEIRKFDYSVHVLHSIFHERLIESKVSRMIQLGHIQAVLSNIMLKSHKNHAFSIPLSNGVNDAKITF